MSDALTRPTPMGLVPQNLSDVKTFADIITRSTLCPDAYRGKPNDVFVAILMGLDLGLSPMQAVQNIAVINGRPCLWGDAMLAVAKNSPSWEWMVETQTGEGDRMVATCRVKRRGEPEVVSTFSMADAKAANLAGKGPWRAYPKRMLQMRARGFALRDAYPDVLRGIAPAEEVADYPTANAPIDEQEPDIVPTPSSDSLRRAQHAPRRRGRPSNAERAARQAVAEAPAANADPEPEPETIAGPEDMPESFRPFVESASTVVSDVYAQTISVLHTASSMDDLNHAAALAEGIESESERANARALYRQKKVQLTPAEERGAAARAGLAAKLRGA
jgi:hypothetical protein